MSFPGSGASMPEYRHHPSNTTSIVWTRLLPRAPQSRRHPQLDQGSRLRDSILRRAPSVRRIGPIRPKAASLISLGRRHVSPPKGNSRLVSAPGVRVRLSRPGSGVVVSGVPEPGTFWPRGCRLDGVGLVRAPTKGKSAAACGAWVPHEGRAARLGPAAPFAHGKRRADRTGVFLVPGCSTPPVFAAIIRPSDLHAPSRFTLGDEHIVDVGSRF